MRQYIADLALECSSEVGATSLAKYDQKKELNLLGVEMVNQPTTLHNIICIILPKRWTPLIDCLGVGNVVPNTNFRPDRSEASLVWTSICN